MRNSKKPIFAAVLFIALLSFAGVNQVPVTVAVSGDITCASTGICTIGKIQGVTVGAPSGTGNVMMSSGATFTGAVNFPAGRVGTFTCSASVAAQTNANILATSNVIISMNTPAGTVTYGPNIKTLTTGVSFVPVCAVSDTSVYNYVILN